MRKLISTILENQMINICISNKITLDKKIKLLKRFNKCYKKYLC